MLKKLVILGAMLSPAALSAADADKSMMTIIIENAGICGWTTVLLSVVAFMLVFKVLFELKAEKTMPAGTVEDVEQALSEQDYEAAYNAVQEDPSFLGRVFEGGLSKVNYGIDAVEKGLGDAWETEQTAILRTASYIQLIGQVAPMLGLFGTVSGMMTAFSVLANTSGAANPKDLAEGIMNALVTTFIGLLVAIPANMCYLFIRNKITTTGLQVMNTASQVIDALKSQQQE